MKKLRYFIEFLLVKFWLLLINLLGIDLARKLSISIFTFIGMKLKATNTARKNLSKIFPKLATAEIEKIVINVWKNLAMVAAETPFLMSMVNKNFHKHVKIIGYENIAKLNGNRALIYTAHYGNWEIIGKALYSMDGIKRCGVYREANNKLVDKIIYDMRNKIPANMVPKGKGGAKQIIAALQSNQQVVMLVDQKMNDGIKVPFLGHDAMTAPAIATLALKYKCPIIPVQIIRKNNANLEVIIHKALDYKEDESINSIMAKINDEIGRWVEEYPNLWFWLHRRWINN